MPGIFFVPVCNLPGLQQRLDEFVGRETEYWDFWGAIRIVKGGNILWETSRGYASAEFYVRNTMSTRFTIASVTKQFTAFAVMLSRFPAVGFLCLLDIPVRQHNVLIDMEEVS